MLGFPPHVTSAVRDAFAAAQRELRLLEQDLGLCSQCGTEPPTPFKERPPRPLASHRARAVGSRRVA